MLQHGDIVGGGSCLQRWWIRVCKGVETVNYMEVGEMKRKVFLLVYFIFRFNFAQLTSNVPRDRNFDS